MVSETWDITVDEGSSLDQVGPQNRQVHKVPGSPGSECLFISPCASAALRQH